MAVRILPRRPGATAPAITRRLFCFPYAGAGAAIFRTWPEQLPADLELCVPGLPGRDARIDEPPLAAMTPLAAALARDLRDWLSLPYALFGHSMGAFVAFDLAHELMRQGARLPTHLFVSGQRGPRLPYPGRPIFNLPDAEFLAGLRARYDSIPDAILQQKELMALLLRTLRADFTLVEDYRYRAAGPLPCPVVAFAGTEDREVTGEQAAAWSTETTGGFALHLLPGGHFFLKSAERELLALMGRVLGE
jgi:medium-chain acyl-[acyl-carrier-protein] hydrolase